MDVGVEAQADVNKEGRKELPVTFGKFVIPYTENLTCLQARVTGGK